VNGGKNARFTVPAPRCIKLHQYILVLIQYHVLVVVRHNHRHRALLLLRNRLALDTRPDLTSQEVIDEFPYVLLRHLSGAVHRELLILHGVLDCESWPFADVEVEVCSVLAERFGVDGGKVDLSFVLFRYGFEVEGELRTLLRSLSKDVGEGEAGLKTTVSGT